MPDGIMDLVTVIDNMQGQKQMFSLNCIRINRTLSHNTIQFIFHLNNIH